MLRLVFLVSVVFSLFCTIPLASAQDNEERARTCYQSGQRAYDLGQYREAISYFEQGYKLSGLPAFLLNIAQAYRMQNNRSQALEFYRRYLQKIEPTDPTVAGVEKIIAELSAAETTLAAVVDDTEIQKALGDEYPRYVLSGLTLEGYQKQQRATRLLTLSLVVTGGSYLGGFIASSTNSSLATEGKSSAVLAGLSTTLFIAGYVGLYASYYSGMMLVRAKQQKRPVRVSLLPLGVSLQF
jgi:tetratricopeptide (TPR) repeat protein